MHRIAVPSRLHVHDADAPTPTSAAAPEPDVPALDLAPIPDPIPLSAPTPAPPMPIPPTEPYAWTPLRQRVFLETLADTGCVKSAAAAAGMSRESAYRLRRRVDARTFRLGWEAAMAEAAAALHEAARERALVGAKEEVWRGGVLVAERRKPSDRMLVHLLKVEEARLAQGAGTPPLAAVLNRLERDAARSAADQVPSYGRHLSRAEMRRAEAIAERERLDAEWEADIREIADRLLTDDPDDDDLEDSDDWIEDVPAAELDALRRVAAVEGELAAARMCHGLYLEYADDPDPIYDEEDAIEDLQIICAPPALDDEAVDDEAIYDEAVDDEAVED
ncbi:MAG: hypothetical protein AAF205_02055 [Pseudomonadota bacterium]